MDHRRGAIAPHRDRQHVGQHVKAQPDHKGQRQLPLPAQGEEYRNLEYFLTYMSNGMEVNGPGARK